jgi:hypothetical protein
MGLNKINQNHPMLNRMRDPDFQTLNFAYNKKRIDLFKLNCIYIINQEAVSIRSFFDTLNKAGCKISREGFINGTRPSAPSSLIITTFARVLNVDESVLFSEDISNVYKPTGYIEIK